MLTAIYSFPVKYHLIFQETLPCPGCAIMTVFVENIKEDVSFGKFDVGDDFLLFNRILLLGKFYIYSRKCQNGTPSLQGFIARTR